MPTQAQEQLARRAKHQPSPLITAWFIISTLVVTWDAGFCLLRPRSMVGGDLQWLWKPYALYEKIDLVYSPSFFLKGDGFTSAQAILNLVENGFNVTYLVLARRKNPTAILFGFVGVLFTLWKTVLYWLQDYMGGPSGWSLTGHNSPRDWWLLFALPNGFWILVPGIIAVVFGRELATGLRYGAKEKAL